MTQAAVSPRALRLMLGRDPHEKHRVASTRELFFDLVFVVAISITSSQLAHLLAEGHVGRGLLAFCLAMFAIVWCWINYSWFCSAFDNDDWLTRTLTLLMMVGVIILGLGLPAMFHAIDERRFDVRVMVAGYVVMRVAMIGLWLRVARDDPPHRSTALTYGRVLFVAQFGWVTLAWGHFSLGVTAAGFTALFLTEVLGVVVAERRASTPWHPHHIAERYNLLALITLGEVVLGTVTAIESVISRQGWSVEAIAVAGAGLALATGMWWIYFALPHGDLLHLRPNLSFLWGFSHYIVYASIAAVGAGLHVAAYLIESETHLTPTATMLTAAIPVGVFLTWIYVTYTLFAGRVDTFHFALMAATALVLVAAVLMARSGVPMPWCLAVLMLTPWVSVVGFETVGHRHMQEHFEAA